MKKKKNNLLQLVEKIDNRLKSIEKQIVDIKTSTNIMNNHVTFVETVWKRVKYPFLFLTSNVEKFYAIDSIEIEPSIKNKED